MAATWIDSYIEGFAATAERHTGEEHDNDMNVYYRVNYAQVGVLIRPEQMAEYNPDGREGIMRNILSAAIWLFVARAVDSNVIPSLAETLAHDGGKGIFGAPMDSGAMEKVSGVFGSWANPVGIQLSQKLVRAFQGAAPQSKKSLGYARSLMAGKTWYIDLPPKSVMLKQQQVRAIFAIPVFSSNQHSLLIYVVLTPPGQEKTSGRYLFSWGHDDVHRGDSIQDVDVDYLYQSTMDLIALSVMYRSTMSAGNIEELPIKSRTKGKAHKRNPLRKPSLFRIERLSPPAGNFGRVQAGIAKGGGWQLGYRVPVRGHFRLQAHGEGNKLRSLRWIDEHVRGAEKPEKPPLAVLRQRNKAAKTS